MQPVDLDLVLESDDELINIFEGDTHDDYNLEIRRKKDKCKLCIFVTIYIICVFGNLQYFSVLLHSI